MTDADYADDQVLGTNTPVPTEFLMHSLGQIAEINGFPLNANKTGFTRLEQEGNVFTSSSKPLKLEDKFTYLGSKILSTESDVNIRLVEV